MTDITLSLSGGGAAGFGHIPVLEALDDMRIRPVAISGTSIGALIGAGYAAGYSGAEMREIAVNLRDSPVRTARSYFRASGFSLSNAFKALKAPETLSIVLPEDFPETFEELQTPLTIVATDFYGRCETRFNSGPLRPAIAASMAVPGVFRPVLVDGRYYVDGGITNNLPLDALPKADISIGVDVATGSLKEVADEPSLLSTSVGAMNIMMRSILVSRLASHPPDLLIEPGSRDFGLLDFMSVHEILAASEPAKAETIARLRALLSGPLVG